MNKKGRLAGRPGSFAAAPPCSGSGRLPGELGKASEALRIAHGHVGEHLAVELDACLLEAVHELRVAEALEAGRRIDAHDPEPAEVPLAGPPVGVRVRIGLE